MRAKRIHLVSINIHKDEIGFVDFGGRPYTNSAIIYVFVSF